MATALREDRLTGRIIQETGPVFKGHACRRGPAHLGADM